VTVYVLFVFLSAGYPPTAYSYPTKVACEEMAAVYRRATCVRVEVPKL
jgi:hypothetical protein